VRKNERERKHQMAAEGRERLDAMHEVQRLRRDHAQKNRHRQAHIRRLSIAAERDEEMERRRAAWAHFRNMV
jgi:hypothetical protein